MRTTLKLKSLLFLLTLMSATIARAETVSFEVSFTEPQAHYADVKMIIADVKKDQIDIKMPVWAPGSYLVREFSKNVEALTASSANGSSLPVQKISKNTWRISTQKQNRIEVNYRVYAFEISVRTSFIDESHAFLSPTGIFMHVDGQVNSPATVTIKPYKGWDKITTGLEPVKGRANTFSAANFDILYDSPIEVGNQDVFEFEAAGVRHEVSMTGGGNYNKERLKRDMAKIVEEQTAMFGENPNKHYAFIVHNYASGGGGLEHLNSTVLGASRMGYGNERSYTGFLGLVSHEYFHLWNVKRLRPAALGPFNYDEENYTTNLWIAEGFTAYYDNLFVRHAGFTSPEAYLNEMAGSIGTVENQPGNRVQPVSEASFDAWIKHYRPNENSRNTSISYYDKGSLIAMVMDLEIMNATNGEKNLGTVMKAMYDEYYKKLKRGYTDAEFKAMAEKVAGRSMDKIYADYVNGTKMIDYNTYLGYAGLTLVNENAGRNAPSMGMNLSQASGKFTVTGVSRNGSAWVSGINVNDEILAIDGYRMVPGASASAGPNAVDAYIGSKKVGDKVNVMIARDGLVKTINATLSKNPDGRYRIVELESPTDLQKKIKARWLKL